MPQKKPRWQEMKTGAEAARREMQRLEGLAVEPGLLELERAPESPEQQKARRAGIPKAGGYDASPPDPNDKLDARNPGVKPYGKYGWSDSDLAREANERGMEMSVGGGRPSEPAARPRWQQHQRRRRQ